MTDLIAVIHYSQVWDPCSLEGGYCYNFSYFFVDMLPHHAILTLPLCLSLLLLTSPTCSMHSRLMHSLCLTHVLLTTIKPCLTHMPQWLHLLHPHVFLLLSSLITYGILAATTLQTSIQLVTYLFFS